MIAWPYSGLYQVEMSDFLFLLCDLGVYYRWFHCLVAKSQPHRGTNHVVELLEFFAYVQNLVVTVLPAIFSHNQEGSEQSMVCNKKQLESKPFLI